CALTGGELTAVQAQPVQVTVQVAYHRIVAVHGDAAHIASRQARLFPGGIAGAAVQAPDRAVAIRHQDLVDRQARTRRTAAFAGPDRAATGCVDGEGRLLVAAGVEHGAIEHGRAVDVGHAVELGTAIRLRDREVPHLA